MEPYGTGLGCWKYVRRCRDSGGDSLELVPAILSVSRAPDYNQLLPQLSSSITPFLLWQTNPSERANPREHPQNHSARSCGHSGVKVTKILHLRYVTFTVCYRYIGYLHTGKSGRIVGFRHIAIQAQSISTGFSS